MEQGQSSSISANPLVLRQATAVKRVTSNKGKKTPGFDGVL